MASTIQFRRGTSTEWSSLNPILLSGELGIELNTRKFKIGDGSTAWNSLAYAGRQGTTGANGTGTDTAGSIQYSISSTAPTGWLRCDGSAIAASTYPNLVGKLPILPAFSGVGAEFGTADSLGISVIASSVEGGAQTSPNTGVQNLTDGAGSYDTAQSNDYPVWHSAYSPNLFEGSAWVKYVFPTPVLINNYYMTARSSSWIPTEWEFQGSNDGINWTVIHHLTGQLPTYSYLASGLTTSSMSQYSASSNTVAYFQYRLALWDNNLSYPYWVISELAMTGTGTSTSSILVLPNLPVIEANSTMPLYAYIKV